MSWLKEQDEALLKDYVDRYNMVWRHMSRKAGLSEYFHKNYDLTHTLTKIDDDFKISPTSKTCPECGKFRPVGYQCMNPITQRCDFKG